MNSKIGYKVVPNATPTRSAAPYLGIAVPNGSLAYDNILKRMVANGTHMTEATARFFLEAFYELAADVISSEVVRLSTGNVALFPNISGGFDSEDAAFDPERNKLFIDAAISGSLQEKVSGLIPYFAGEADGKSSVKLHSAYDPATKLFGVINGTDEFRLAGVDLTVPDAEDESLALMKADLSAKVADLVVVSTDGGQQITVRLSDAAAVPVGKYRIRLASHGLDPTATLAVVSLPVTLAEAVEPEPIAQTSDGKVKVMSITDGGQSETFTAGHELKVNGEGLFSALSDDHDWYIRFILLDDVGLDNTCQVDNFTSSDDGKTLSFVVNSANCSEMPAAGTYDATVALNATSTEDESVFEELRIPIKLVVNE